MMIDRRLFLAGGLTAGAAGLFVPRVAYAVAATPKRLVFVLQRGASDGLDTLAPVGDPAFAALRSAWLEREDPRLAIDAFFALHPALRTVGALYAKGQATFVHATGTAYRDRSHFEAQNLLETGGTRPYGLRDGWLNRLVGLLPDGMASALALTPSIPLALQGKHETSNYAPSALRDAGADLSARVADMYAADPLLSKLWDQAESTKAMVGDTRMRNLRDAKLTGELAASLMARPDGARIMMVETSGWDTHQGQPVQHSNALEKLDAFVQAFQGGMGEAWSDTLVVVATEFGRTARVNGTNGTDHGTASMAMLLGGAARGGRIVADWPGLRASALHEGRDLRPTLGLESVLAGSVADHFGLDPRHAMNALFPGRSVGPTAGLITT